MTSGEDLPERAVVVLDTTEFHGARRLDSKAWRRLLELSHEGKLDVGIPEVVLRETERHFRSDFTRAVKDLRKSATAFQILSEPASEIVEQAHLQISNKIDVETEIEAVRHRLEEHRVAVLPLPETSAEEMLGRDLSMRRPFNESGKGHRDTLIWLYGDRACTALTSTFTVLRPGHVMATGGATGRGAEQDSRVERVGAACGGPNSSQARCGPAEALRNPDVTFRGSKPGL